MRDNNGHVVRFNNVYSERSSLKLWTVGYQRVYVDQK